MLRVLKLLTVLVVIGLAFGDLVSVASDARATTVFQPAHTVILEAGGQESDGPCTICADGALLCQSNTCRIANADAPVLMRPHVFVSVALYAAHDRMTGQHPSLDPPPPEV